jgi:RNA polymerase sigma-70 factor (ECF subfamily)
VSTAGLPEQFGAAYPRNEAVVGLVVGDQAEAEDLTQEAFARLVPRWDQICKYDDPEAWVRRVALRLASNRLRKLRNRGRAYQLHGMHEQTPAASGDLVDVTRALGTLSLGQRQVVVLHYLLGFDISRVAAELGIPSGTVKSRLSRSRAALAPLLTEETADA